MHTLCLGEGEGRKRKTNLALGRTAPHWLTHRLIRGGTRLHRKEGDVQYKNLCSRHHRVSRNSNLAQPS